MTWTHFFSDVFAVHIVKVCGISTFMRKTNQKTIIFLFVRVLLKTNPLNFFNLGKQQLLYNFGNLEIMNSNNVISVSMYEITRITFMVGIRNQK